SSCVSRVHRGGSSPVGWKQSHRLAGRRPGRIGDCRSASGRAALPLRSRALRDTSSLAGVFADAPGSADRARTGGRTGRGHFLALLDDGMLDSLTVSQGRPDGLAGCHDRVRGTGLHDPARGSAAAAGARGHSGTDGLSARLAVLLLIAGPLLVAGPFVALKGGIATKPAVARLLGLAARSSAMAVERERPLDPGQSTLTTYVVAGRA